MDTIAECLQPQMSVLHQSMCIFKAGPSGSYDGWAKYKEKVPDVSDPNQNLESICNSNSSFCEELLSRNHFEAVLVNLTCYDYGANAC